MNKILKIYIVEDFRQRREGIQDYFKSVNELLKGETYDKEKHYKDSHVCFQKYGFEEIELKEILPGKNTDGYNDYIFSEKADWVKEIQKILAIDEKRIFLVDFALNSEERKNFQNSENKFRAQTARKILDYIDSESSRKEYIIYESVVKNMVKRLEAILDIGMAQKFKNVDYGCLLGNYFKTGEPMYEKVAGISSAFDKIMEKMKND